MRVWQTEQPDKNLVCKIAAAFNLSGHIAGLVAAAGFAGIEEISRFLDPKLLSMSDPFDMQDMEKAVDRIWDAILGREVVAVYGDYDADGMTSVALLVNVIKDLGGIVEPWIPVRVSDGYGLGIASLERLLAEVKPSLVVTVDCGTNSVEAAGMLSEAGVDLIITDHHEVSSDIARAFAIVNPKLGSDNSTKMLAGAGVAFKLCHGLVKRGRQRGNDAVNSLDLRDYLDLAAVGTVADIVPLTGENRVLVKHGIERLNRTKSPGLKALLEVSGVKNGAEASHIGFSIGPRLNAAGRLGEAETALRLLLERDAGAAKKLALRLDVLNKTRRSVEEKIFKEAAARIDSFFDKSKNFGIVVCDTDWHQGVIGIVASRLAAFYSRPVAVIAVGPDGTGRGSCRSVEGYSILKGLELCSDLLENYGGHDMAAGFDVKTGNIPEFTVRFNEAVGSALKDRDLAPVLKIGWWLELNDTCDSLLDEMAVLRPFGNGNPVPVWAVSGVRCAGYCAKVGSNHLKFDVTDGNVKRSAIAFGMADRPLPSGRFDIAFTLQKNSYQGNDTLQLNIKDFR